MTFILNTAIFQSQDTKTTTNYQRWHWQVHISYHSTSGET